MDSTKYLLTEDGFVFRDDVFPSVQHFKETISSLSHSMEVGSYESSSFVIRFDQLYKYRSLSIQSPSASNRIRVLGVPDYDHIRLDIQSSNPVLSPRFRLAIKMYNNRQDEVQLKQHLGDVFLSLDGKLNFLSKPYADFVRAWDEYSSNAREGRFTKNIRYHLEKYAKLVKAYDGLDLHGTSCLDINKVRVLDGLDYNLVCHDDGLLDVVPHLGEELKVFDPFVNQILESANRYSDNLNLTDNLGRKNYKVVFSESAAKKWQSISDLKRLPRNERSNLIKQGGFIAEFPPTAVIGDIYSARVVGFVFETPAKMFRDKQLGQTWNDGLDEISSMLRSRSGAGYGVTLCPEPEFYEEIKRAFTIHTEKKLVSVADANFDPSAAPALDEDSIYIASLKDSFSAADVDVLLERIEKHNVPTLSESELPLARQLISEAVSSSRDTLSWIDVNGEEKKIPVRSLQIAIDRLDVPASKTKSVNVKIFATLSSVESKTVFDPDWYMSEKIRDFATSQSFSEGTKLLPHQLRGFAWLYGLANDRRVVEAVGSRGGLLADDMGLGKTIQVIRLLESVRSDPVKSQKPVLIVGPISLLKTSWEEDGIRKFFNKDFIERNNMIHLGEVPPSIPKDVLFREVLSLQQSDSDDAVSDVFKGLKLSNELLGYLDDLKSFIKNSIVFCSYETLRSRSVELASLDFSLFVCDEAQHLKNQSTGVSSAAKAIKADFRVALTGTPIENSISDLWNICDLIAAKYLGSYKDFNEKYTSKIAKLQIGSSERQKLAAQLESDLRPIWLRRTKKDVADTLNLPDAIHYDSCENEIGQIYNKHLVPMSEAQIEIFKIQVAYFNESHARQKLAAIRNMMEACFAPWWARDIVAEYRNFNALCDLTPKLKCMFEIIESIAAKNEKVIIFANVIELQRDLSNLVYQWYFAKYGKSVDCEVFNGELSQTKRVDVLKRFKSAAGFKCLVISPRSGGAGLNITEANHVIHYTREWNPAMERQATGRVHRIGQKKVVHVYYPTSSMKHLQQESAEEHLANILQSKRGVIDDFTVSEAEVLVTEKSFDHAGFATDATILSPEGVVTLGPLRFEKLVAKYFESKGYSVEHVGSSGDGGCDVIARSSDRNLLIQCKFTEGNYVQNTEGIREIRGAHTTYEKRCGEKFSLAVVTNSVFSPTARSLALDGLEVDLIEGKPLFDWLKDSEVSLASLR